MTKVASTGRSLAAGLVSSSARGAASVAEARDQDLGVRYLGDVVDVRRIAAVETVRHRAAFLAPVRVSYEATANAGSELRASAASRGAPCALVRHVAAGCFVTARCPRARIARGGAEMDVRGTAAAGAGRRSSAGSACGLSAGPRAGATGSSFYPTGCHGITPGGSPPRRRNSTRRGRAPARRGRASARVHLLSGAATRAAGRPVVRAGRSCQPREPDPQKREQNTSLHDLTRVARRDA